MDTKAGNGWWQASDGYWYPPDARPEMPWHGEARGPHGEQPPGPGWWLAADYQWYPPDARPGEVWADPVAVVPVDDGPRRRFPSAPRRDVPAPTGSPGGAQVDARSGAPTARPESSNRVEDIAQAAGLDVVKGLVAVFAGMLILAATKGLSGVWPRVGLVGWVAIGGGFGFVAYGAVRFARSLTRR